MLKIMEKRKKVALSAAVLLSCCVSPTFASMMDAGSAGDEGSAVTLETLGSGSTGGMSADGTVPAATGGTQVGLITTDEGSSGGGPLDSFGGQNEGDKVLTELGSEDGSGSTSTGSGAGGAGSGEAGSTGGGTETAGTDASDTDPSGGTAGDTGASGGSSGGTAGGAGGTGGTGGQDGGSGEPEIVVGDLGPTSGDAINPLQPLLLASIPAAASQSAAATGVPNPATLLLLAGGILSVRLLRKRT